jgi:hypothetical protein
VIPLKEDNLKPFIKGEQRQKDLGKMGGIASGESRRRKKTLKDELIMLLESDNNNNKISTALLKKALDGDIQAFTTIRDTIGEKPTDKIEQELISTIRVDIDEE